MIRILLSTKLGELRWTQADLARATGIRPNTINELYHELVDRVNLEHLDLICEPLEGVNKIAKTIENKGFSRKGKADGKNFVRWKPLHILERCKEKRQGKAAVRHGLGIVFKL